MANNVTEGFEISPQQKRLCFLQQQGQALFARCAILLEGELSRDALQRSLQRTVERHEILRTTFERVPSLKLPLQVIAESGTACWAEEDWSGSSPAEQEARLEALWAAGAGGGLTCEHGQVLRARLIRLDTGRHVLVLSLPALCADSRSLQNLAGELCAAYADADGADGADGEPLQYADYTAWQAELLAGENAVQGRAFWAGRAPSLVSGGTLPFRGESRPEQPRTDAVVSLPCDAALTAAVSALTAGLNTSAESLLLTCWHLLLWRLAGRPSGTLAVAQVCDGRKYEELDGALGLFARAVPVACQLSAEMSFGEALAAVSRSAQEVYDWQEFFGGEADGEDGVPAHGFEWTEAAARVAAGVKFSTYRQQADVEVFEVNLRCVMRPDDTLLTEWQYDAGLYTRADVERLGRQYLTLLESLTRAPHARIGDLDVVSREERQQLLVEWNDTRREQTDSGHVHELFERQAERTPEAAAVIFGDEQLSYAELNARANQLARHLRESGVGPESLVGILMERSAEMVVAILAVLKAGGAYLPLDPEYPQERLSFMLADSGAQVLLTQEHLTALLPAESLNEQLQVVALDDAEVLRQQGTENLGASGVTGENLAYVIYTSGSTGRPKGVMISHSGLSNYLDWAVEYYRVADGQGAPVSSPLAFDLTVTSLLTPLVAGRSVHLLAEGQGIEALAGTLRLHNDYSLVKLTPAHLEALGHLLHRSEAAGQTRALVVGGEALHWETIQFWQEHAPQTRIINEYGPTETVVGCCVYEVSGPDEATAEQSQTVPIGRPIANTQLYILDERQRLVPQGVAGELYIAGAGLARGYMKRADLTAERFVPHPFSAEPGARLYRTGDVTRHLRDGRIEYLGRTDEQVKIRGYRIELGEIEAVLGAHPGVREAVVVARADAGGGRDRQLVAYLVARQGQAPTNGELRAYMSGQTPDYMIPSAFVTLDALPLTPNGKVDRRALPAPSEARPAMREAYVAPRDAVEEVVAGIWAEVLGLEAVGVNDDFFELGGHSLLVMQAISRIRDTFQLELPPSIIFDINTVAQLSEAIRAREAVPGQVEKIADILVRLEGMSEEDAYNTLQQRSTEEVGV